MRWLRFASVSIGCTLLVGANVLAGGGWMTAAAETQDSANSVSPDQIVNQVNHLALK
jgi:hypothetical protein